MSSDEWTAAYQRIVLAVEPIIREEVNHVRILHPMTETELRSSATEAVLRLMANLLDPVARTLLARTRHEAFLRLIAQSN